MGFGLGRVERASGRGVELLAFRHASSLASGVEAAVDGLVQARPWSCEPDTDFIMMLLHFVQGGIGRMRFRPQAAAGTCKTGEQGAPLEV